MRTNRLREILNYNPETGIFSWKNPNQGKAKKGQIINGWNAGKGYKMVGLDFHRYYLHRLAWQYVYGKPPKNQIDHINCIKTDNRICNLREATATQNAHNMLSRKNISGYKGVYFERRTGKWFSAIRANGKSIHLGTFNAPQKAHDAYAKAARKHFGEFARTV